MTCEASWNTTGHGMKHVHLHMTKPYLKSSFSNVKPPLVKLGMEIICFNFRESFIKLRVEE